MPLRRLNVVFIGLAISAVVLAGCPAPAATPAPTTTEAPAATAAPATMEAQVATAAPATTEAPEATTAPEPTETLPEQISIAIAADTESLDPVLIAPWDRAASMVAQAIYETLVTYDPDKFGVVAPGLAKDWAMAEDGTSVTFSLRDGAVFATGDPVTTADVVFSIERLKKSDSQVKYLADTIDTVAEVDEHTVVLRLSQPDPAILAKLAAVPFSIVSKNQVEGQDTTFVDGKPAGSGPYVLTNRDNGHFILKPNPNFLFDEQWSRFEQVDILTTVDSAMQLAMLNNGEIDIALDVKADLANSDEFQVYDHPSADVVFLAANPNSASSIKSTYVQAALRYALNYESIAAFVGGGAQTPPSFIPQGFAETLPEGEGVSYNPDLARALMDKGGYNGEELLLAYYPTMEVLANVIRENLEQVGFKIKLQSISIDKPFQQLNQYLPEFDLTLYSKVPSYIDVQDYLDFLPGGWIANAIGWQDEEFGKKREQVLSTLNLEERAALLSDLQTSMIKDEGGGPFAYVVQPGYQSASRSDIVFARDAWGSLRVPLIASAKSRCARCCANPTRNCCCRYRCSCNSCNTYACS